MTSQKELIPMRPGDLLRYEREQKGLTIEKASGQSRIKPSVLEAIESGETGDIPSVYLKGYIRNYARFLNVDLSGLEEQMEAINRAAVENARRIIDAVKPKRAKLAYEMMGWALPDSADSYLRMIKAVDRDGRPVLLKRRVIVTGDLRSNTPNE